MSHVFETPVFLCIVTFTCYSKFTYWFAVTISGFRFHGGPKPLRDVEISCLFFYLKNCRRSKATLETNLKNKNRKHVGKKQAEIQNQSISYALVRPFLYFDRSTSTYLLRPPYFDSRSSTSVLRPFVLSGLLIGREVQVEVQFWSM